METSAFILNYAYVHIEWMSNVHPKRQFTSKSKIRVFPVTCKALYPFRLPSVFPFKLCKFWVFKIFFWHFEHQKQSIILFPYVQAVRKSKMKLALRRVHTSTKVPQIVHPHQNWHGLMPLFHQTEQIVHGFFLWCFHHQKLWMLHLKSELFHGSFFSPFAWVTNLT